MRIEAQQVLIDGPVGAIDTLVEAPAQPKGIALIGHPHPLFGGANTNKVAQTLAKTMTLLGYVALRPNFRGVGKSAGSHDEGRGESEDLLAVLAWAKATYGAQFGELPVVLCGFSFGAYVAAKVASRLAEAGTPALRLVLVGTAAGHVEGARKYDTAAVAPDTIVIHGSADETVPLYNVLQWAEPMDLPVSVIAGADHFFHRRLHVIRDLILRQWKS
ncbi:MAG TPA: alpha/beta fold hydrolase [Rhodocyclaceae bacterium]|nr:alpha/beta fold hydrolase [Rhodocyclaceae bacterium]